MSDGIVVVFGSESIRAKWIRTNRADPEKVILATHPEKLEGHSGPVLTVRVPKEQWLPTTFPCEKRVRETEDILKRIKKQGGSVGEAF
jgi:hypothetical protein